MHQYVIPQVSSHIMSFNLAIQYLSVNGPLPDSNPTRHVIDFHFMGGIPETDIVHRKTSHYRKTNHCLPSIPISWMIIRKRLFGHPVFRKFLSLVSGKLKPPCNPLRLTTFTYPIRVCDILALLKVTTYWISLLSWAVLMLLSLLPPQASKSESDMRDIAARICRDYLTGAWKTIPAEELQLKRISGGLSNFLYYVRLPDQQNGSSPKPSSQCYKRARKDSYSNMLEPKEVSSVWGGKQSIFGISRLFMHSLTCDLLLAW